MLNSFKNPTFLSFSSDDQNFSNFFTESEIPSAILPNKNAKIRHPPIPNYTQLKTIIEDSETKINQNQQIRNIMPNIERYKAMDASTHELVEFKLMDLRDVTPNHNDSSNEDEDSKPCKPNIKPKTMKYGNAIVHKQHEVKKTIAEIDNILKIGSFLNQEDSNNQYMKEDIKERTNKYSSETTRGKPKDRPYHEHKAKESDNKRKEIEEARRKYEQITNELYHNPNTDKTNNKTDNNETKNNEIHNNDPYNNYKNKTNNNKTNNNEINNNETNNNQTNYNETHNNTNNESHNKSNNKSNKTNNSLDESSYVLKTQETQENYGPKMVPYTFPVEASKNLKNLSNNTMNLASPMNKHKAFDTKNDDIKGFDGVFKLTNATNANNRIFPKKIEEIIGLICFDCQDLIETANLDDHMNKCPPIIEGYERISNLPQLNQDELEKLEMEFERNLLEFNKLKEKSENLMKIRAFVDNLALFKTIQINSNFLILSTALRQMAQNFKDLDNIKTYINETFIVKIFKSLENLSRAKILLLKYQINSQKIRNSSFYKNQLYEELKQLELETISKEKDLLEEIAARNKDLNKEDFESDDRDYKEKVMNMNDNNNSWTNYSSFYEENEKNKGGNEKKKREFYSEAVRIKLELSNGHKGRDVVISDLYEECNKLKVRRKIGKCL